MRFMQRIVALAGLATVLLAPHPARATEQSSYVMPGAGPMSMATFVTTYLNPGLRAIAACHNGTSAPANGPSSAALLGQCWLDTTANPNILKRYDGAQWVAIAYINTSTHAVTFNKVTITAPASGSTLTIADGKTLTVSNTITLVGTDGQSFTFPNGSSTVMTLGNAQTVTGVKGFNAGTLTVNGATSGALDIRCAATCGSRVITFPAGTTDFSGTGGASQVVRQSSAGAALTVSQLAASDLSNGTSGTGAVLLQASPAITGTLDIQQEVKLTGDTSPAQITSNQNNYAPANFSTNTVIRINSDAARDVTGLTNGVDGLQKLICNVGSFTITFKNESASSTAGNRFSFGGDLGLAANYCARLIYDATASRWRSETVSAAAAGSGTVTQVTCDQGLSGGAITTTGTCGNLNPANLAARGGGFDVWQQLINGGTTVSIGASATVYANDAWYLSTGANQASTVTQVTGIAAGSTFAAKVQRNNGQTGTGAMRFSMPLDTDELVPMRGANIAISFTIKAGANWSPTSGTIAYTVYCGTGAVAKRGGSSYTGETTPISTTVNLTGSAVRVTATSSGTVGATCAQAEIQFAWAPTGTAGADDSFTIDDLQLETVSASSSTASPYKIIPFSQQLRLSQRFYYVVAPNAANKTVGIGQVNGTADNYVPIAFPVTMRSAPSFTISVASDWQSVNVSLAAQACGTLVLTDSTFSTALVHCGASSLTSGQASLLQSTSTSAAMAFSSQI